MNKLKLLLFAHLFENILRATPVSSYPLSAYQLLIIFIKENRAMLCS